MERDRFKPLYSLLLLLLAAPVLAALMSPWIYQFLQRVAVAGSVLDAPFYRVTSRVVLIMVLLFLYPAYRLSGMRSRADIGLSGAPDRWRLMRLGMGIGAVSMLIVYFLGVALNVFALDLAGRPLSFFLRETVEIVIGALLIGVLEEILFRGYILNALRRSAGVIAAILISSFLYSIVHFMRPIDPENVEQWNSGFLLLQNLFARAGDAFLPEFCALFIMGIILSILTFWTKSVYVAIGLHTGWVWVMMFFRLFTDNRETMLWLYGRNEWVSKGWIGTVYLLLFLAAVFATRRRWKKTSVPAE